MCKKVPIHSSTASKTAAHNSHPKSGPILVTNIYATSSQPQPALVPSVLWLPATTAFWSTVDESSLHIGKELSSLNAEKKGTPQVKPARRMAKGIARDGKTA